MKPWLRWTLLTILVLGLILFPFALWEESVTTWSARLLAPSAGRAAIALVVVALLASDVLLPVPSSFVAAGAVSLLGAALGGVAIALGMTLGGWIGYLLGRWGGEPLTERVAGRSELSRARALMERHGSWLILVSRGFPVLAEASTLLAGATRLSLLRFGLATTLGNLGIACAYALIGLLNLTGWSAMLAPFAFGIFVPAGAMLALRALTRPRRAC